MTALFRRMLSPRDRNRHEELSQEVPSPLVPSHLGQKNSDANTIKVDNAIYSEPSPLDIVPPRGEDPNSPLPPSANSDENDTYYSAPADTLSRDLHLHHQQRSTRDRERAQAQERRHLEVHERTLNQMHAIGPASGGVGGAVIGHRRTRSGGHIIDNDEYSTPWNAAQAEEQRRRQSAPPRKHHLSKRGIPATPNDGTDDIIPVSPPPILSASQDRSQSASPIPLPPSHTTSAADAEYDDPWDVKNRNISQAIPGRHHAHSVHERRPSTPPLTNHRLRTSVGSRVDHHRHILAEETRLSRTSSDKNPRSGAIELGDPFRSRAITDLHLSVSTPNSPRPNSVSTPVNPIQRRPLPDEPPSNPLRREPSPVSTWFDSKLALEEQTWYHGAITRAEAEAILSNKPDFSFLVRNSESCRTDYSLSIRDRSSGFIHLRLVYERSGYVLGQFSSHFQTVPECIFFYTQQRLNIRGTEHKKLRYPVSRDRLFT